jgi:hypothetical protein
VFRDAFVAVPLETVRVHGASDGPEVKAVRRDQVQAEFETRYTTGEADQKKAKATSSRAFRRALESARKKWDLYEGKWGGTEWFWRVPKEPGQDAPITNQDMGRAIVAMKASLQ